MKTTRSLLLLASALCLSLAPADLAPLPSADAAPSIRNQTRNTARNTNRNNRNDTLRDTNILANIGEDWYLEFTPAYIKADTPLDKFLGASLAFGYVISHEDKIQLEIGLFTSKNYQSTIAYDRTFSYHRWQPGTPWDENLTPNATGSVRLENGVTRAKAAKIPIMFSYSYCMKLDSRERLELRVTPAIGFIAMSHTWSITNAKGTFTERSGLYAVFNPQSPVGSNGVYTTNGESSVDALENFSGSGLRYAFALGAGFGFTWHFADRWYLDGGYRWTWTDKVSANTDPVAGAPWNAVRVWSGMNTHTYTVTVGWKF